MKFDPVNNWGFRQVQCENLDLYFNNYNYGDKVDFDSTFSRGVDVVLNVSPNVHAIDIFRHNSTHDIVFPQGATHYSFTAGLACCSSDMEKVFVETENLEQLTVGVRPLNTGVVQKISLLLPEPQGKVGDLLIFSVGIHFWYYDNGTGKLKPVANGRENAAKIVYVQ